METTDSSGGPPPQPNLPPGFRFHPTDEELVIHYLKRKADSSPLPVAIIADVDLYKHDPWELPGKLNQNQTGQIRIVFFCFFPDHFCWCLSKFLQRRLCSENKSGTSSVHVIGNIQTELDRTELLLPVIGKRPVQINRWFQPEMVTKKSESRKLSCSTLGSHRKELNQIGSCMNIA